MLYAVLERTTDARYRKPFGTSAQRLPPALRHDVAPGAHDAHPFRRSPRELHHTGPQTTGIWSAGCSLRPTVIIGGDGDDGRGGGGGLFRLEILGNTKQSSASETVSQQCLLRAIPKDLVSFPEYLDKGTWNGVALLVPEKQTGEVQPMPQQHEVEGFGGLPDQPEGGQIWSFLRTGVALFPAPWGEGHIASVHGERPAEEITRFSTT